MAKKSQKLKSVRAPGMTQISISLPETLVGKVDALADADNRNRSNFIANVLTALAKQLGK